MQFKKAIFSNCLQGISLEDRKLSAVLVSCVAMIAHFDWLDDLSTLFNYLKNNLITNNPAKIHGSVEVLLEISNDFTESQVKDVLILMPDLLKIFNDYSQQTGTRKKVLQVIDQLITTLGNIHEVYGEEVVEYLQINIQPWIVSFEQELALFRENMTLDELLNALDVIEAIVVVLTTLYRHFHEHMAAYNGLQVLSQKIFHEYLNGSLYIENGGHVEYFAKAVFQFLIVIHGSIGLQIFKEDLVLDVLGTLVMYVCITDLQIQSWADDLDLFLLDQRDDSISATLRTEAEDTIWRLITNNKRKEKNGLGNLKLIRLLQQAVGMQISQAWKLRELCERVLGILNVEIFKYLHN
ncbi:Importin 9, partial [Nowakowskiella sp. JEL0078]